MEVLAAIEASEWIGVVAASLGGGGVVSGLVELHGRTRLANLEADLKERTAEFKAGVHRTEKIRREIETSRRDSYAEFWKLTYELNLFGPEQKPDLQELSANLRDWYFEHGQSLTAPAKRLYFLLQEALGWMTLRSTRKATRPADKVLYASDGRTVDVLDGLRHARLGFQNPGPDADGFRRLAHCVNDWKEENAPGSGSLAAETNWLMLQLLMSQLRSQFLSDITPEAAKP